MKRVVDIKSFCRELDQRLAILMASFRELHNALPKDQQGGPLQVFFRELFALQAYFQEHQGHIDAAPVSEHREKQFEWLYKSSLILNASLEAPALLELALDTLLEMGACGRGFIATLDGEGDFVFVAARNFKRETIPDPEREISRTVIQQAMRLGREVRVGGEQDDQSILQRTSFIRQKGGLLICVPVFIDHEVKAVIYLDQLEASASLTIFNMDKNFSLQLGAFMKHAAQFAALKT